jgi:archaellum biogenesis protein FlaJ (TadC family)
MPEWITRYLPEGWGDTNFVLAVVCFSIITAVVSILICAFIVSRLPADYFLHEHHDRWADRHPFIRWPFLIAKNLLGVVLVLLGIILSLPGVPGQGILTILIGAMLINFPGKRAVEKWLLTRRGVLKTINKLRARAGRAPLQLDATSANP